MSYVKYYKVNYCIRQLFQNFLYYLTMYFIGILYGQNDIFQLEGLQFQYSYENFVGMYLGLLMIQENYQYVLGRIYKFWFFCCV